MNNKKPVCMSIDDKDKQIQNFKDAKTEIQNKINEIKKVRDEQINQLKMNFNDQVDPFIEEQKKCCVMNTCKPTTEDSSALEKLNSWNCKNVCSDPYKGLRL